MSDNGNIILAIESAICGGSISLLADGVEMANWVGSSNVSKAEDLLFNIDAMLTSTNVSRHDIDLIAVSAGPGSFTGIRIGLATALGLTDGLGIKMSSGSALKAMVWRRDDGHVTAALPVGRNSICLQSFQIANGEVTETDEPRTLPDDDFFEFVREHPETSFVLHESLYEKCSPTPRSDNFGTNIARVIGLMCATQPGIVAEPLFISKSV